MPSVFSKIILREIPAFIVAENTHFIAFLDINPLVLAKTPVGGEKAEGNREQANEFLAVFAYGGSTRYLNTFLRRSGVSADNN